MQGHCEPDTPGRGRQGPISNKAAAKGLKINTQKTQILSVSSGFYTTKAVIKDGEGTEIESSDSQKILGYTVSNAPTIQAQLDYLIRKSNKRLFLLIHYKRSRVPTARLRDVYVALNKSILEYTSNVYHSQINIGQSNEVE